MKNYIAKGKVMAPFLIISLAAVACNSTDSEKQVSENILQPKVVQVEEQKIKTPSDELPKEQVCMVNNAFMGKKQIPVAYENKTYYGCCEMCVNKIKIDKVVRYATDPHTGKEIDKATAFIVLNPAYQDGSVLYFESEKSFNNYKAKPQIH